MLKKKQLQLLKVFGLMLVIAQGSGCCGKANSPDRFECINRAIYGFNKTADRLVIKPTARAYDALIPSPIRTLIGNFFQNLSEIPNIGNDILQGNFSLARKDTARLILNSTWGIGGLLDVAQSGGLARNHQDFGLTLARWGYKDSSYLVLPFLGPSTVRDAIGRAGTYYMGVPAYLKSVAWRNRILLANFIDTRASLLKAESVMSGAVDEYIFVRDAYLQHRQYALNNEGVAATTGGLPETSLSEPPE